MRVIALSIMPVFGIALGALLVTRAVHADDNAAPAADAAYASDGGSLDSSGEASEPSSDTSEQVLEIPQTYSQPQSSQPESAQPQSTQATDASSTASASSGGSPDGADTVAGANGVAPDQVTAQALPYGTADEYENQALMNPMLVGAPLFVPGPYYGPYYGPPAYYVYAPPRAVRLNPEPVRLPVSAPPPPPPRVRAGTGFGGFAHPGHLGGSRGGGFGHH